MNTRQTIIAQAAAQGVYGSWECNLILVVRDEGRGPVH